MYIDVVENSKSSYKRDGDQFMQPTSSLSNTIYNQSEVGQAISEISGLGRWQSTQYRINLKVVTYHRFYDTLYRALL